MELPKISIVTPSFNQGNFLEDTILSVLGQNYINLEYIVIDGGSTDNSVSIIKKYQDRISYWISEKDAGQSEAINKGFKQSTGDILMWINSDDLLMPNVLNYIASTVISNKNGFYFGNCIRFEEKNRGIHCLNSDVVSAHLTTGLEQNDFIFQPSSFWTRNVYDEVGPLNENLHYGFDWEWFLRVKENGIKMMALNKCISMYRKHDTHKSRSGGEKRQEELLKIYEMYNPRGAKLFHKLMDHDKHWNKVEIYKTILLKKVLKLRNKAWSEEKIMRFIQPKKYAEYSEQEINLYRRML
jgi:glycosyltransferase involved in cell wall biosynthesis